MAEFCQYANDIAKNLIKQKLRCDSLESSVGYATLLSYAKRVSKVMSPKIFI